MSIHDRYGKHIDQEEIEYQLREYGKVEECESEIVCPYCGLIIEPDFETDKKDLFRVERECPECEKTFFMDGSVDYIFYYETWRKDEGDE